MALNTGSRNCENLRQMTVAQIMKMADSVNAIFGEMEDAGVNLTEKEKIKVHVQYFFQMTFKNIIDVTLETTARQLYESIKDRIFI